MKSRALEKEEVMILLDLVSKHKIVKSKSTNATNNLLKEDAWRMITQEFSATVEPRRPEQLRLKWENLKKAARKRISQKASSGGKTYFPPNETLDRVTCMLGETCGDTAGEGDAGVGGEDPLAPNMSDAVMDKLDYMSTPEQPNTEEADDVIVNDDNGTECSGSGDETITPKRLIFKTPKNSLIKRRKLYEEVQRAKRDRDQALAAYFNAKAQKVNLENIKLKLEIEQLRHLGSGAVTQILM